MRKPHSLLALLFIYSTIALKISFKPVDFAKELKHEGSLNTLFAHLIYSSRLGSQGFRLITTLIKSESTDFRLEYLKFCKNFTIFYFIDLVRKANRHSAYSQLDWEVLFSPDCLSAGKIKFGVYGEPVMEFLNDHGIYPIQAKIFRPTQWTRTAYIRMLKEASLLGLKFDWNSLCADVSLDSDHLSPDIWNSDDKLWRYLNHICLSKMEGSNRVMLKNSYISIFKSHPSDSREDVAMKIVSTLAAYLKMKSGMSESSRETKTFKSQIAELFAKLSEILQSNDRLIIALKLLAGSMISDTSIVLGELDVFEIIKTDLVKYVPLTANWMLDLSFVFIQYNNLEVDNGEFEEFIDWFLDKEPFDVEICHFLKLTYKTDKTTIVNRALIDRIGPEQISNVYKKCPELSSTLEIPLKTRMNRYLISSRKFRQSALSIKVFESQKNSLNYLCSVIQAQEPLILSHLHAEFTKGFGFMNIASLSHFFIHFLYVFLQAKDLYIKISELSDGRPIIVPSLSIHAEMWKIILSVIIRSSILEFKLPFIIDDFFFERSIYYGETSDFFEIECTYHRYYTSLSVKNIHNFWQNVPTEKAELIKNLLSETNQHFLKAFPHDYGLILSEMYQVVFKKTMQINLNQI